MITNVKRTVKKTSLKLVIIIVLLTLVFYVLLNTINENKSFAAQTREPYSSKINNYPGYKALIDKLKKDHPNWNFTIFYTGLDWSQVIKNETSAYHGRNVVPSNKSNAWKCPICGDTPRGGSSWRCASEAAVSYYMDTRNWLNDNYIFEFESLSYNGDIQTLEGVQKIISGIKYMQGDVVTYTKTDGTKTSLQKSYAQIIMDAAKEAGISPYHLASRIRQEQGAGSTPGSTATGTYPQYIGYYNFLNIKASGATDAEVIANGLTHAKNNNWTNPEISIKEGAKVLAKNYINDGQDTLYLQKFDVDSSDGTLYYFQYMQNVSASVTEGTSVRKAYQELNLLNSPIDFIIPVYENMPETPCQEPIAASIVTQNVKVKGTKVSVRQGQSTSTNKIATVNTGDTLLRIEIASTMVGGYYWDKVVLPNGIKGYVARTYLVETADITNCNDTMFVTTSANLRNGPGLNGTTIVTMLTKGQAVTRIEKGVYNLDGYIWDRVKLQDGRQGYIAQNYIGTNNNTDNGDKTEIIKVICKSGLKVREEPGTNKKVLTYVDKNDILTRTKANVSIANGYIWDKIVTTSGIEGYIARGTSTEQYIEVVNSNTNTNTQVPTTKNDNFKLENTNAICEPETSVESIKEKYSNKTIIIKKPDGTQVSTGIIGTGYNITIDNKSYTVIKLGDVNGDGKINSGDSLILSKQVLGKKDITDKNQKLAGDVNKDGKINSGDTLIVRKQILGKYKISI